MRVRHTRAPHVAVIHRPAHPLLVPPDLVHPVVVAPGIRDARPVKIPVVQQRPQGVLPARRSAIDTHPRQVKARELLRRRPNPQNPVRKTRVLQIFPTHIVKSLRAVRRPHAVHLDHDVTFIRQFLLRIPRPERLRHKRTVRPGVDVLDHRVLLPGIEIRRPPDDPVDVRHPVATLGRKRRRRDQPAGNRGRLQRTNQPPVLATPQFRHRQRIHPRPRVDQILPVRRELRRVRAIARRQHRQPGAVKVHPAALLEIGVLSRHNPARREPDLAVRMIHPLNRTHHPFALRDLVFHRPGFGIIEIQMIPPVAFGHPDELTGFIHPFAKVFAGVIDECLVRLVHDGRDRAGIRRHRQHAQRLMPALVILEREPRGIRLPLEPVHAPRIGEQYVAHRNLRLRVHREQMRDVHRHRVTGLQVGNGNHLRLHLVLRRGFDQMHLTRRARPVADGDKMLGVRRPIHFRLGGTARVTVQFRPLHILGMAVVGIVPGAIGRQRNLVGGAQFMQEQIVPPHQCRPFVIRRDHAGGRRFGSLAVFTIAAPGRRGFRRG